MVLKQKFKRYTDFEVFKLRVKFQLQSKITKEVYEDYKMLVNKYSFICLDLSYGNYIFKLEKDSYLLWSLGNKKTINFLEAQEVAKKYYHLQNLKDEIFTITK